MTSIQASTLETQPTTKSDGRQHDPATFAVIKNRLEAIAREMMATVERTAWTAVLALARDYSCAIYDAHGRQVSAGDALPIHTTSMHLLLEDVRIVFGTRIEPGDVFLTNHPYRGNTHVADVVSIAPVFVGGKHLFWTMTKGHQLDIGATTPSSNPFSAENVWQEGLHVPPVKIVAGGETRQDVIDMYYANVRYPDLARGDLLAQLGSIERGRSRLVELVEEYGADTVEHYVDALLEYADRRMAQEIETIPDGEYFGETWVDSDGAGRTDIQIRAKVTVQGSEVEVDFRDSAVQSLSSVNGTLATALASAAIPFISYIDPDIPHNEGCFRHIHTVVESGTICYGEYPASTALATTVPADAMQDAVHKAMITAVPERVTAGGCRAQNEPQFSGIDRRTGTPWSTLLFNGGGGGGATAGADGWPMFISSGVMGGEKAPPIEQLEMIYPFLVERVEIETDSMGLGARIGGPGTRLVVRPTEGEMECVIFGDGVSNPPHGVLGGTEGAGGGHFLENTHSNERTFISPLGHFMVAAEDRWVGVSTGGGGYGNPLERSIGQVVRDVRDGLVSAATAAEVFGVVVRGQYNDELDEAATAERRAQLMDTPLSMMMPDFPSAGRWLAATRRAGDAWIDTPKLSRS